MNPTIFQINNITLEKRGENNQPPLTPQTPNPIASEVFPTTYP